MITERSKEAGATVNEVVHYLPYSMYGEGVEPVVSWYSELCAHAFDRCYDVLNYGLFKGASYVYPERDREIGKFFNINKEHFYSLAADIVKREYENSWAGFINEVISNIPDQLKKDELTQYYKEHYSEVDNEMSLQGLTDLIDGEIINDARLVLDAKAELMRCVVDHLKESFEKMHGVPYDKVLTPMFAAHHEKPFPKANITYK